MLDTVVVVKAGSWDLEPAWPFVESDPVAQLQATAASKTPTAAVQNRTACCYAPFGAGYAREASPCRLDDALLAVARANESSFGDDTCRPHSSLGYAAPARFVEEWRAKKPDSQT